MTLKQLEAFYWAGICSSFAIAAEKLNISASTLSKRIAELETGLGRTLFDRRARSAALTSEGVALLKRAGDLLLHAQEVEASVGLDSVVRGRCRIGVGEIAASSWLPKLVAQLRDRYPDLSLEPYIDLGAQLESRLIAGKLDAAMIARKSAHPALNSVFLAEVEYIWVAAAELAKNGKTVEELILETQVVTMSREAGSTRILDAWQQDSQVPRLNLIESNSMATMAGLVSAGLAIGYLPSGWLQPLLRNEVLKVVHSRTPLKCLDYWFHWRADDSRALVSKLREVALDVVDYDTPVLML